MTAGPLTQLLRRRLDPDERFGLRLTLVLIAILVFVVPFLLLWLLVEDQWHPLARVDRDAARALNNAVWHHPAAVDALKTVSVVFHPDVFRVVAAVVVVWLLRARRIRHAVFVGVCVFGGALLDGAVKLLVHRHRPVLDHPVAGATGYSFPSGHALGSVVGVAALLAVFTPLLSRRGRVIAGVAASLVIAAVGFSRIGLGVHYVSDVVAGWVLGGAWALGCIAAFEAWRHETHDLSDVPDEHPPGTTTT